MNPTTQPGPGGARAVVAPSGERSVDEPCDGRSVVAPSGEPGALTDFTPFFKAFCSDTRAAIIEQLMTGEKCVCEITAHLSISQPLISHHLSILREAGFVRIRGAGARTYYALDWERFDERLQGFVRAASRLRDGDAGPSCACG
jgi:ArsR family transcriptional regulator